MNRERFVHVLLVPLDPLVNYVAVTVFSDL